MVFFTGELPLPGWQSPAECFRYGPAFGGDAGPRSVFGTQNRMNISSAYDDFCSRTLAALDGVWQRLCYLAELRAPDGRYRHWGMARTFGDEATQHALAQAHTELFLETLRMPLRHLAGERKLVTDGERLSYLPTDLGGGTPEHFNSVVSALAALSETRPPSPHPAA